MNLSCKHIVIRTADVNASRAFYCDALELELLENEEHFFAIKAGALRISVFGGAERFANAENYAGVSIILATDDVVETRDEVLAKGLSLADDIIEAPGFMKFFTLLDPDSNIVHIGEYLTKDTLTKLV